MPETVTIRRLLNHTSGVPSYTDLAAYSSAVRAQPSAPWTYDEVATSTRQLDFLPGQGWRYSNTGYMLLHRLIETVTRRSFADAIRSFIFEPLARSRSYVAQAADSRLPIFTEERWCWRSRVTPAWASPPSS